MTLIHPKNQAQNAAGSLMSTLKAQGSGGPNAGSARTLDLSRFAPAGEVSQKEKVEKQVRTWVGQSFYGTLLKQMRESPFKSEIFDGGRGGEAFGQLFDQRIAQHMAGGVGSKIVRPMVKKILNTGKNADTQYRKQKQTTAEAADGRTDRRA